MTNSDKSKLLVIMGTLIASGGALIYSLKVDSHASSLPDADKGRCDLRLESQKWMSMSIAILLVGHLALDRIMPAKK